MDQNFGVDGTFQQTPQDREAAESIFKKMESSAALRMFSSSSHVRSEIDMSDPIIDESLRSMTPDGAEKKRLADLKVKENLLKAERSARAAHASLVIPPAGLAEPRFRDDRPPSRSDWMAPPQASGGPQGKHLSPKVELRMPKGLPGTSKRTEDSRATPARAKEESPKAKDSGEDTDGSDDEEAVDEKQLKRLVEEFAKALNIKNAPQKAAIESAVVSSFQARVHGWHENMGPMMAAELGQFTGNVIQSVLGALGAVGITEFKNQTEIVKQVKEMCQTLISQGNKRSMRAEELHKETVNAIQSTLTEDLMKRSNDLTTENNALREKLALSERRQDGVSNLVLSVFNNVPYMATASKMSTLGKTIIGDALDCEVINVGTAIHYLTVSIGQKYEMVKEIVEELREKMPHKYGK